MTTNAEIGSGPFVLTRETPWTVMTEGVRRQILGYGPDLMMVRVDFDAGARGAVHHHPHRQATYVADGVFEVTVGEETRTLGQGDSFFAVGDQPHGVLASTKGTLIDVFTPARAEFIA